MQMMKTMPAGCLAQRSAVNQCRGGIASPRRIAQAVHTSHSAVKPLRAVQEDTDPEEFEGLAPEDDVQIPGGYRDAMSSNTPLGKAVKDACNELDTLVALERETLTEADALLKKLGIKTSIFDVPATDTSSTEED